MENAYNEYTWTLSLLDCVFNLIELIMDSYYNGCSCAYTADNLYFIELGLYWAYNGY